MWSKFVESLNAGFFQYRSFIHLTHDWNRRALGKQLVAHLLIFGYPWRISRMLHLKCLT